MRSREYRAMERLIALEDIIYRLLPGSPGIEAEEVLRELAHNLEADIMVKKARDPDVIAFKLRRLADQIEADENFRADHRVARWWSAVQDDMAGRQSG